jgi:hypothetical protein
MMDVCDERVTLRQGGFSVFHFGGRFTLVRWLYREKVFGSLEVFRESLHRSLANVGSSYVGRLGEIDDVGFVEGYLGVVFFHPLMGGLQKRFTSDLFSFVVSPGGRGRREFGSLGVGYIEVCVPGSGSGKEGHIMCDVVDRECEMVLGTRGAIEVGGDGDCGGDDASTVGEDSGGLDGVVVQGGDGVGQVESLDRGESVRGLEDGTGEDDSVCGSLRSDGGSGGVGSYVTAMEVSGERGVTKGDEDGKLSVERERLKARLRIERRRYMMYEYFLCLLDCLDR